MHAKGLFISLLFACIAIVFGDEDRRDNIQPPLKMPQPFNESILPLAQRSGEVIAGLGKVMKIDTFTDLHRWPNRDKLRTTFDIFQRSPTSVDSSLTFHKLWKDNEENLKLSSTGAKSRGPYEFDLSELSAIDLGGRRQFMIVIPGYRGRRVDFWSIKIRRKWLDLLGDAGGIAIEVHWNELELTNAYHRAVANTVLVARQVTILLHYLAELSGTHLKDPDFLARVHLIGHSLGAHIAGFVGKDLEGKLGRITALDPAGPSFDKLPNHQRLHRTDACLVEVLHTNSGRMEHLNSVASATLEVMDIVPFANIIKQSVASVDTGEAQTAWFGIDAQLGHIDYYANNGRTQPGCDDVSYICDHKRASQIYLDLLAYMVSVKEPQSTVAPLGSTESQQEPELSRQLAQVSRLRAFKSPDYESFATGHSFVQNCPQLMDIETHLNSTAVLQAFDQCSVPLFDITKPLEELIDELKTKHGINFDEDSETCSNGDGSEDNRQLEPSAALGEQPSFYFKTTDTDGDLVSYHSLLKIYLTKPISWNEAQCSLEVEMIVHDGDEIRLQLKRLLHLANRQTILAVPFIHQNGSEAKNRFIDLIHLAKMDESSRDGDYMASSEFSRVFRELFPEKISLKLAEPDASGIFSTVYNLAKQIIKSDDEISSACQLAIDMIEVHPLIYGIEKNFGALYGRDLLLSGSTLQVISASEQIRRHRSPSRRETTLSAEGINCLAFGLDSAVVG